MKIAIRNTLPALLVTCISAIASAADEQTITLYNQSCIACHASGAAGAPRTGDTKAWAPRLEKGMDTLVEHTREGFNAMPPKGMCFDCTDEDYVALINFMAGQEPATTDTGTDEPAPATTPVTPPPEPTVDTPDTAAGTESAQSTFSLQDTLATCTACHGADGNSPAAAFPKLAGQNSRYLVQQMQAIQCADLTVEEQKASRCMPRSVPTMAGLLTGLTTAELTAIANVYTEAKTTTGQADPDLVVLGESIYRGGISDKGVAACAGCHAPDGAGNALAGFPALAGQHAEYIAAQLIAYRAAADGDPAGRDSDGETQMMRTIASRLSDREIEAVASFASGLY